MASPSEAGAALSAPREDLAGDVFAPTIRADLPIAVRGGGHCVAGMALNDGGVVVDLRHMRAVTVDPDARAVRVAGDATMSDLDRACEPYGPATTRVGGFVLGGGSGWL